MNLLNLSALVEGKLSNSPSITSFTDISFEASKVKRGELFVALKHEEIDEAILNGAYGILFDKPTQISDQEIAWIKVESMDNALLRLFRFRIMEKSPQVYSCDSISLKLASQIITSNNLLVLQGSLREHINELYALENESYILFDEKKIDNSLFIEVKKLSNIKNSSLTIVEQTLFETSFIYDDTYYERQLLSPFFMPYLEGVLQFFKQVGIKYQMREFKAINHFQPVFTNVHFQVKEFGQSDKVLIFEPEFELIKAQVSFLNSQANWAKIIYLVPSDKVDELEDTANVFSYDSSWDIMQVLKQESFHFALIAQQTAEVLNSDVFAPKIQQPSLF